jgi:hypothetical protein
LDSALTDTPTARIEPDSGAEWAASLFARQNAPAETPDEPTTPTGETPSAEFPAGGDGFALTQGSGGRPTPVDLSAFAARADPDSEQGAPPDPAAQTSGRVRGWAAVLIGLTAVCSVVAAAIMVATSRDDPGPPKTAQVPVLAVGQPTVEPTAPAGAGDDIIPYMAAAEGCYEGSTSPGALQETDTESAWECVRGFGAAGGGTNGQLLKIKLGNEMTGPRWYLVSKVEITPGWVAKVQGGRDEWSQHRVPTLVRFVFNDSTDPQRPPTHWDVDTRGVRGPVPFTGAKPVLASEITMVILQTTRPPADDASADDTATSTASTPQYPELTTSEEPTEDPQNPAAVDATFAVSLLKIEGRTP